MRHCSPSGTLFTKWDTVHQVIAKMHRGTRFQTTLSHQFLDHLTSELYDRLLNVEDLLNAQFLITVNLEHLSDDKMQTICQPFQSDLPALYTDEFESELLRWKLRGCSDDNQPSTFADTLATINEDLYPNVTTCLSSTFFCQCQSQLRPLKYRLTGCDASKCIYVQPCPLIGCPGWVSCIFTKISD